MCSCTKPLIFVFLLFIFFQIQFRWERDSKNIPKWMLSTEYYTSNIHMKQSIMIPLDNYTLVKGDAFVEIFLFNHTLKIKDNIILKINTYIEIESAPLSYHHVKWMDKMYYTRLNMNGKGSIHFNEIINTQPNDKFHMEYLYDYSDIDSESTIFMNSIITNGFN